MSKIIFILLTLMMSRTFAMDISQNYIICQNLQNQGAFKTWQMSLPGQDSDAQMRICQITLLAQATPSNFGSNEYELEILKNDGSYETCFADIVFDANKTIQGSSVTVHQCFNADPKPRIGASN